MAQYRILDPDELMECPYDNVHMVRAKRFQYHLMKCRKNYTGKDFVTCPFNAKHEMPKPELRHHLGNCPDKAVMDPETTYNQRKIEGDGNMLKGCTEVPVYNDLDIESSEDWDTEASVSVRRGPMYDQSYFGRVKFHDPTQLNKQQRKVLKDNRLTAEQKMEELKLSSHQKYTNVDHSNTGDSLRLPKTSSRAAMPAVQPVQQPQSSVFAYSVCGRGRGRGMVNNGTAAPLPPAQPVGIGRGLTLANGGMAVGRGSVPPPPGFCVPNVYHKA